MSSAAFPVIHVAGSLYDGEACPYFRTGTPPPPGGTVNLNGYHSYRSLMWVDAAAVTAALEGKTVLNAAFSCSCGMDDLQTREACPVRLYRTDLTYDPDKAGMCSADTTRFDEGMTFEHPVNEHMLAYGETDKLVKGSEMHQSVFMQGDEARALAESLKNGCAIGTWNLKEGSVFFSTEKPYMTRFMTDMCITLNYTEDTGGVLPPTDSFLSQTTLAEGLETQLHFSGADTVNENEPITGYLMSCRDIDYRSNDDHDAQPWSEDVFYPMPYATQGDITVTAPAPYRYREFRIATRGRETVSDYALVRTLLYGSVPSDAPTADVDTDKYPVMLRVHCPPAYTLCDRYVCLQGIPYGMVSSRPEDFVITLPLSANEYTMDITLKDSYGSVSEPCTVHFTVPQRNAGRYIIFNHVPGAYYGLYLLEGPTLRTPDTRAGQYIVADRSGSVPDTALMDLHDSREMEFVLYAWRDSIVDDVMAYLSGSGELAFSDRPNEVYDVAFLKGHTVAILTEAGGCAYTVRALCRPYIRHADERTYLITERSREIFNHGAVPCEPMIDLTGTGSGSITLNDETLTVDGMRGNARIDCMICKAWDEDGNELACSGVFPRPGPGTVSVTLSGAIERAQILLREGWL